MIFVDWFTEAFDKLISFFIKHGKAFNLIGLFVYFFSFLIFLFGYFAMNISNVATICTNATEFTGKMIYVYGVANALTNLVFIGMLSFLVFQMRSIVKTLRVKKGIFN